MSRLPVWCMSLCHANLFVTVVLGGQSDSDYVGGRSDAVNLMNDLMSDGYTRYVRPVVKVSTTTTVKMRMSLNQLVDVVRMFLFSICKLCRIAY